MEFLKNLESEYNKIKEKQDSEPLLNPENNRLVVKPIKYPKIWNAYKKHVAAFWTTEEIDFSRDYQDFCQLSDDEQYFIKNILAFFAASDTIVNINLSERFTQEVQILEAIYFWQFQAAMENCHSDTYSLQIETLIKDEEERINTLNAVKNIPCVQKKAEWAFKWIKSDSPFAMRLVAFAIVEGVFFSGSFCAIFWLKDVKNKMQGLISSNELISRDEAMHTDFACLLYSMIKNRLSVDIIHGMFKDAVEIEKEFIIESLPCMLLGMNSDLMIQYIQFVADRLLVSLGYPKIWNTKCPFNFMEKISLGQKTNFFEETENSYSKAASGLDESRNFDLEQSLNDDF